MSLFVFYYLFSGIYCASAMYETIQEENYKGYEYGSMTTFLLSLACFLFGFIIMPWQLGSNSIKS